MTRKENLELFSFQICYRRWKKIKNVFLLWWVIIQYWYNSDNRRSPSETQLFDLYVWSAMSAFCKINYCSPLTWWDMVTTSLLLICCMLPSRSGAEQSSSHLSPARWEEACFWPACEQIEPTSFDLRSLCRVRKNWIDHTFVQQKDKDITL